ncbi:protein RoBo-1-like [Rattus rattus]|uniref:protein RoBo-1-like n=1 Tax=Rattus rattus TaxID=10117 RepID=UPI0013F34903|nr:protein RoBo-1-like [Rattus rattus]
MGWFSILKSLFTVFVFSILVVGSVEGYTCSQATCGSGNCPEPSSTCDTTVGCFNQIQKLETPSPDTKAVFEQKGCNADKNRCDLEFSITLGNQHTIKYKNQCCTSEQCNKEHVTLSQSSEINGVECTALGSPTFKSIASRPIVLLLLKILL